MYVTSYGHFNFRRLSLTDEYILTLYCCRHSANRRWVGVCVRRV